MPATRATSKLPHRHDPFPEVHRNKRKSNSPQPQAPASDDVIVLSSSDDEARPAKKTPNNKIMAASNKHPKSTLQSTEVIEISDDEDYPVAPVKPSRNLMKIAELQSQIETLKESNTRMGKEIENYQSLLDETMVEKDMLSNQVAELHLRQEPPSISINPSDLEDQINCEICTMKMWRPYLLPECGHSFCESCIQDWFSTILARHIQAHPEYNANNHRQNVPAHIRQMMPYAEYHPQVQQMLAQYNLQNPQPEYNCPTCRVEVKSRPIEDFALKAIVRVVAKAQGEVSPQKPVSTSSNKKGKRRAPQKTQKSVWDPYFPPS
ncbi:hypothetical protein PLEOSDRAFT_1083864 [Pleurotus ostreatus PC15]|uniref:RING-type domain-containing protein n=1 Tax=Pleurotus ostreatus (strain PC15) TaxID=1137138 RepID=A0A067NIV3_PLEO1|nr:hypothetical protein PLEOSDRAFT_1083864 [Pleurotus ostreatus PC15]